MQRKLRRPYCVTHHGVRFSRACLAIGKHAGVETLKCSFQDIRPQVMKNLKKQSKGLKKKKSILQIIIGKHAFHLHYNTNTLCRWLKQILKTYEYPLLGCKCRTSSVSWIIRELIREDLHCVLQLFSSNRRWLKFQTQHSQLLMKSLNSCIVVCLGFVIRYLMDRCGVLLHVNYNFRW